MYTVTVALADVFVVVALFSTASIGVAMTEAAAASTRRVVKPFMMRKRKDGLWNVVCPGRR